MSSSSTNTQIINMILRPDTQTDSAGSAVIAPYAFEFLPVDDEKNKLNTEKLAKAQDVLSSSNENLTKLDAKITKCTADNKPIPDKLAAYYKKQLGKIESLDEKISKLRAKLERHEEHSLHNAQLIAKCATETNRRLLKYFNSFDELSSTMTKLNKTISQIVELEDSFNDAFESKPIYFVDSSKIPEDLDDAIKSSSCHLNFGKNLSETMKTLNIEHLDDFMELADEWQTNSPEDETS